MASDKRTCYTCGTQYEYCTRCAKYASQPKWRWMWDTEECKDIYDVVAGYKMNVNTSEDVKAVLDKYNVSNYNKYTESISKSLNELFSNSNNSYSYKKNKKNKNKVMDVELEKENVESESEIVNDIVDTPIIENNSIDVIADIKSDIVDNAFYGI